MDRSTTVLFVVGVMVTVGILVSVGACRSTSDGVAPGEESLPPDSVYTAAVQQHVTGEPSYLSYITGESSYFRSDEAIHGALQRFYQRRDYQLAWGTKQNLSLHLDALKRALRRIPDEGVDTTGHGAAQLARRIERVDRASPEEVAALDVYLSFVFMHYADNLLSGRIDSEAVDPNWYTNPRSIDLADQLASALDRGTVEKSLSGLAPPHLEYRNLREALVKHRKKEGEGGLPEIPSGSELTVGDTSGRVPLLQETLAWQGDSTAAAGPDSVYTRALARAVTRFQRRHALKADGVLGDSTLAALNVPMKERIRTLEINMERWRWLPNSLGERYVLVNIPEFKLHAYREGEEVEEMSVVVGERYNDRATPIFSDMMEYVVFNPYWNVPQGIAKDEILPKAREDTSFLSRHAYQVVESYGPNADVLKPTPENLERVADGELRIRQAGTQNALGDVKFMFPNQFAVYLHDTPAQHLFDRTKRAFSHGCIRVEEPAQLAEYVLAHQPDWDAERIREVMQGDTRQRVNLSRPVPVYILYWTARAREDGTAQFYRDIYGYDNKLSEALD
jgi:murein L,D-transpeptidase YcbB/YkuD